MKDNQLRYFTRIMETYQLETVEQAQRFYKLYSALKLLPPEKRKELLAVAEERVSKGLPILDK